MGGPEGEREIQTTVNRNTQGDSVAFLLYVLCEFGSLLHPMHMNFTIFSD